MEGILQRKLSFPSGYKGYWRRTYAIHNKVGNSSVEDMVVAGKTLRAGRGKNSAATVGETPNLHLITIVHIITQSNS
jgi:hypothetical protein